MEFNSDNSALKVSELRGVYPAIITPMLGDGIDSEIDYRKLCWLIDDFISCKVSGIVIAGTTGQSATLGHGEQADLVRYVYEYVDGETKIIASAGSNSTKEAIEISQHIEDLIGPTTFLHVTGYYNNPPQAGLIKHFEAIADSIDGNIIMYNVPGRTASNIEAKTAIYLSKNPKIIGLKEASGNLAQVKEIIDNTNPDEFRVLSGEDHLVADIVKMGGFGVISASANVAPKYFVKIVELALNKEYDLAEKFQQEIIPLVKQGVFAVKNPISLAHMFNTGLRLPLCKIDGLDEKLEDVLKNYSKEDLGIDLEKYKRM
jgi:4-hydroxy-tetrahydrodipicolinate synthase